MCFVGERDYVFCWGCDYVFVGERDYVFCWGA